MHFVERIATTIRQAPLLRRADPLWRVVRPMYERVLGLIWKKGLPRRINGTDVIRILPELHGWTEVYEPDVWQALMKEIRPGDVVADVGAAYGLYTVALAKRVGASGRVYAFEPNPTTLHWLRRLVVLNGVRAWVNIMPYAVGDENATLQFDSRRGTESHISGGAASHEIEVQSVRLDDALAGKSIDIMKIDVEGYEEHVLRGAHELLSNPKRAPRKIFIEVHPYAWQQFGASSESLLAFLHEHDYQVFDLQADGVQLITDYGEIVATRTLSDD